MAQCLWQPSKNTFGDVECIICGRQAPHIDVFCFPATYKDGCAVATPTLNSGVTHSWYSDDTWNTAVCFCCGIAFGSKSKLAFDSPCPKYNSPSAGAPTPNVVIRDYSAVTPPFGTPVIKIKSPAKCCLHCGRDWCAELDSYYGKDDYLKQLCSKCRKASGVKE